MAKHSRARTIAMPWRRVGAALPAVALFGGGIALIAPAGDIGGVSLSKDAPAVVVPDTALTMPRVPADPLGQATQTAPALALPEGTMPGSSTLVTLDSTGIPVRALEAYRRAASLIDAADTACHIDWPLVAAIGRVESNHARFGGNHLDSSGVAQPGIIGVPLDGSNGTTRITDTDGGLLDHDTAYDRAVGPMQFIPGTWRIVGSDADGDGVKNPQSMADAATSTAIYLCSGPGDLSRPGDLHAAILRYNGSDSYARTVTAIADAYRHGVITLPASDLPAAHPAPSRSGSTSSSTTAARPAPPNPAPSSTPTGQQAAVAPSAPTTSAPTTAPTSAPTSAPPQPGPALPLPAIPIPGPASAVAGVPTRPLTEEICTSSPLGVTTCTIVPLV
ncbi:MAG: lytic transglycosylase domain-containing protein [Dermatophilaceae bacterium]